jgi:hypothetical protein
MFGAPRAPQSTTRQVTNFTSAGVSGEPRRALAARYLAKAPPDS